MTASGRGMTAHAGDRALYPLSFGPIFEYRLWGGRRLAELMTAPLPGDGPIGEAWVLSDRPDHQSRVASGPLAGVSLRQLLAEFPEQMLGRGAPRLHRFPLLLKFLDARELLSVQVHPSDRQTRYLPAHETGKNEAWVVLEAGPEGRIYAGLEPGTTPESLGRALGGAAIRSQLAGFRPHPGDAVFLPAGTVHSLGGDVVVFEVQQNSDVTFRLCDWDRIDPTTGRPRDLQVDQALACTDFTQVALGPVLPAIETLAPVRSERLFDCEHFSVRRLQGELPFRVGAAGVPRILVCIGGAGEVEHGSASYPIARGEVLLLPAVVGSCILRPRGPVSLLEVALPESSTARGAVAPEPEPGPPVRPT